MLLRMDVSGTLEVPEDHRLIRFKPFAFILPKWMGLGSAIDVCYYLFLYLFGDLTETNECFQFQLSVDQSLQCKSDGPNLTLGSSSWGYIYPAHSLSPPGRPQLVFEVVSTSSWQRSSGCPSKYYTLKSHLIQNAGSLQSFSLGFTVGLPARFPKVQIIFVLVSVQSLVECEADFLYLAIHIKPHDYVIAIVSSDIGLLNDNWFTAVARLYTYLPWTLWMFKICMDLNVIGDIN